MKLTDDEGVVVPAPDATGGMSLDAWEYFAAGVVGNPVGYVATSAAHLIRHPRRVLLHGRLRAIALVSRLRPRRAGRATR